MTPRPSPDRQELDPLEAEVERANYPEPASQSEAERLAEPIGGILRGRLGGHEQTVIALDALAALQAQVEQLRKEFVSERGKNAEVEGRLQLQVEQGARREADVMRACLKAEKFDAQYENSRLPGDSALSVLFNSFEECLSRLAEKNDGQRESGRRFECQRCGFQTDRALIFSAHQCDVEPRGQGAAGA